MLRLRLLTLSVPSTIVAMALVATAPSASAAQAQVGLGTATSFAVLGGSTVTNTGPTTISGDVGLSPGTAVVGFPPGLVTNGTIHAADAVALQAQDDVTTAFNDAAGRGPVVDAGVDLGGQKLLPGVYNNSTSMGLTGTVTLDALGDPAAVFIFQAGSTLITASNSTVALVGAAQACNVFWEVGSSATIGTDTTFVGTVMALTSITMQTGARIQGRLLARNGAVTLDTNVITRPSCATVPPPSTSSPTPSPSPTSTATSTPSPTGSTGGGGGGSGSGSGSGSGNGGGGNGGGNGNDTPNGTDTPTGTSISTPVVPPGHPETGGLPAGDDNSQLWLFGALFCVVGATAAAARSTRRRVTSTRA
jgi:hypothetical protein